MVEGSALPLGARAWLPRDLDRLVGQGFAAEHERSIELRSRNQAGDVSPGRFDVSDALHTDGSSTGAPDDRLRTAAFVVV